MRGPLAQGGTHRRPRRRRESDTCDGGRFVAAQLGAVAEADARRLAAAGRGPARELPIRRKTMTSGREERGHRVSVALAAVSPRATRPSRQGCRGTAARWRIPSPPQPAAVQPVATRNRGCLPAKPPTPADDRDSVLRVTAESLNRLLGRRIAGITLVCPMHSDVVAQAIA
jgi:hypothetical protein